MSELKLRPEVAAFAQAMERTLRKHDRKKGRDGWKTCTSGRLLEMLSREHAELIGAFVDCDREREAEEVVDLANLCMMFWDVHQG